MPHTATGAGTPRSPHWGLILLVAVLAVVGAWAARTWLESSRPVNLLIMGIDDDRTRTDVVVLAHFDPRRQALSLVSLHRDLLVEIPCPNKCLSPDKLAHAHAYGELKDGPGGPQLAIKTVEKLLGIRIDGYVRFDYEGFNKVVDALGGVEIVIDRDMYYEDPYARPPLKIQFTASPAPQRLNGEKALDYVRFREDGRGDVGRIERTQRFFYALYDTARREGSLARVPDLVRAVYPHVKTDISLAMALSLAKAAASVERESIRTATVPGAPVILKDGRWVWAADAAKLQELVDSLLVSPVQARNP